MDIVGYENIGPQTTNRIIYLRPLQYTEVIHAYKREDERGYKTIRYKRN